MSSNQFGQIKQTDFVDNTGGTNLVDSVFKIKENQAAGGYNFDYLLTGGFRKRLGAAKINSSADTALYTLGFGQYAPTSGTAKYVFRAADRKFQLFDTSTPAFTSLSEDTVSAGTTPFAASTTQDVQFVQFSNGSSDILWGAGGGATLPVGAYSTTKYTANGSPVPTGSFSATPSAAGTGSWTAAGTYFYAIAYRKAGTLAISNAVLDVSATTTNTTDIVTINLAGLTGLDTTKVDKIYIYRSARSGVTAFTTGNLIAQLTSSVSSFVDNGTLGNTDILVATNIPRSASTVLDNSVLPTGTYNTLAIWGNRLCTSSGNSLYISDVNKSESWPLTNYITVPSAGPITALATVSFTSSQTNGVIELLAIFKEKELWVLSAGSSSNYTTWSLVKIDGSVGCPQQSLVVSAQGFLAWIDVRGIWLWDGTSKPVYSSRLLEPLFGTGGDLDKSKFNEACGALFKRENQIIWYLSSKTYGEQKFCIKMDLRLTLMQVQQDMAGRTIDGVFIQDVPAFPIYSALAYTPLNGQNEQLVLGDNAGYCYFASNAHADGGAAFNFRYLTAPLNCGNPNTKKQFNTVIAWVQDVGSWNLYLDYWADYETATTKQSTIGIPITTERQSIALWDIASWDYSYWDAYYPKVVPIIFNLQPGSENNNQGHVIQLQFRNDTANQPITVHGFSLLYSELGGITA